MTFTCGQLVKGITLKVWRDMSYRDNVSTNHFLNTDNINSCADITLIK